MDTLAESKEGALSTTLAGSLVGTVEKVEGVNILQHHAFIDLLENMFAEYLRPFAWLYPVSLKPQISPSAFHPSGSSAFALQ